jgi:endo-1,4-beta-xylanase
MKHRLLLVLVVLVLVPFFIVLKVSSTPSAPTPTAEIAETSTATSLRSLAQKRGISIGAAVQSAPLQNDANYRSVLAREFNMMVPENAWKFELVHPQRDRYDFREVDALMAFAKANHMQVRGHPLLWYYALPQWLTEGKFTRDELLAILREHIQTVVGRYRGQVAIWDVVNEALNRDGSLRDTMWLRQIGPEYLDLAFRWTHEADPQARLFYGDYSNEEVSQKSDGMYLMVQGMLQRGVPINGVGLQTHLTARYPTRLDLLAENIKRFGELGLEVQFTELDIKIADISGSWEERLAVQAQQYANLLRECLRAQKCTGFITWGFTDRYSWIGDLTGEVDAPLIFDKSYSPKPAYNALKEVLSSQ